MLVEMTQVRARTDPPPRIDRECRREATRVLLEEFDPEKLGGREGRRWDRGLLRRPQMADRGLRQRRLGNPSILLVRVRIRTVCSDDMSD
jgi:hypothetical protein